MEKEKKKIESWSSAREHYQHIFLPGLEKKKGFDKFLIDFHNHCKSAQVGADSDTEILRSPVEFKLHQTPWFNALAGKGEVSLKGQTKEAVLSTASSLTLHI